MKGFVYIVATFILFTNCSEEEVSPTYKDQLALDVAIIDDFLAANGITAESDTSGLRYLITTKGSNFKPLLPDSIQVNYSLTLLDGTSIFSDANNTFLLSKLIRAWRIALPLVGEGAKLRLYVPSGLAYGAFRTGPIPANSNLIFDIELKKVIREFTAQQVRDVATIDAYLLANSITARKDAANLRYVVTTQSVASALTPLAADSVVLTYTTRSLPPTTLFESENLKGMKLNARSTLPAWKTLLPLLREGTKATVYVPSGMAYGAYGKAAIPPYANLIYQVELVKVIRR